MVRAFQAEGRARAKAWRWEYEEQQGDWWLKLSEVGAKRQGTGTWTPWERLNFTRREAGSHGQVHRGGEMRLGSVLTGSVGNGSQWRGLGKFGSYPEERGQGGDKAGGRETDGEAARWSCPGVQ